MKSERRRNHTGRDRGIAPATPDRIKPAARIPVAGAPDHHKAARRPGDAFKLFDIVVEGEIDRSAQVAFSFFQLHHAGFLLPDHQAVVGQITVLVLRPARDQKVIKRPVIRMDDIAAPGLGF